MNWITHGTRTLKAVDQTAKQFSKALDKPIEELYDKAEELTLNQVERAMRMAIKLQKMYDRIAIEEGIRKPKEELLKQTFFISMRPDTSVININEYLVLIHKFLERNIFETFTLAIEQKGETPADYGKGFHAHILCKVTCRSKGELLRCTQSTFKSCTSANCIEVRLVKTKQDYDNALAYIEHHESKDGHKEKTKDHDKAWRQLIGLKDLYTEDDFDEIITSSIKSGELVKHLPSGDAGGPIVLNMG